MDVKKSYKADLDRHRASGFLTGLVVVLSLFVAALEFTTQGGMPEADDAQAWLDALDAYNRAISETKTQEGYPLRVVYPDYPTRPIS